MSVLVIDVGTSGIRAAVMQITGEISAEQRAPFLPETPFPGLVEFDAAAMAKLVVNLATAVLAETGPVKAVGIANQRASTVVWDRNSGIPVAPAIGWQDLRTLGECLAFQADGFRLAPNHSATKVASILDQVDPDREKDLCFGTVDSWLVWSLTNGEVHVTDLTNASVTGLITTDGSGWDQATLDKLRIPATMMPKIVDSWGPVGQAYQLPGRPTISGIAGDQQASLVGQGCVHPGLAKITFGTGGMLDVWLGEDRPNFDVRGPGGTFPLVTLRSQGKATWGIEAIMLAAGSNIEWLRDDLGIIPSAEASHLIASGCESADGVIYVPALLGLGTPQWDYGARGALFGLTRGTTRAHIVRAVLEGVAYRGVELVEAAEADSGISMPTLRVDGGMSMNPTFLQAFADASGRRIEVSPVPEATTVGAGYLAGLGIGLLSSEAEINDLWSPKTVVEPIRKLDRDQWTRAVERSAGWHSDLSTLSF